jgi:hypothetical protein
LTRWVATSPALLWDQTPSDRTAILSRSVRRLRIAADGTALW